MKPTDELLPSFDKSWQEFAGAWKKARAKASEKSIHDLRVSTRRLIATLELARALTRQQDIAKIQSRFKKVLKSMSLLRDLQVQLDGLSHMPRTGIIADFKKALERRAQREIIGVQTTLKHGKKRRLSENVQDVRSEFERLKESLGGEKSRLAIQRVLTLRRNEFVKAERRFHQLQPLNDEALHEMRIALKKLRYVVEAAQPVLDSSAREIARRMQQLQQLLGDTRDVDMLRIELEKWASRRGKKIAVVPALDRLLQEKETLLKKIIASPIETEQLVTAKKLKPAAEKTHIAAPSAVEDQGDEQGDEQGNTAVGTVGDHRPRS